MKAEDTVMSDEKLFSIVDKWKGLGFSTDSIAMSAAKEQAEITWAARQSEVEEARKAGIKEVVDYLAQNYSKELFVAGLFQVVIPSEAWQVKLKDWGYRFQ